MTGWICPILQSHLDEFGRQTGVTIIDPPKLAGMSAFIVQAQKCMRRQDGDRGDIACGLVRNHDGPCWSCTVELLDQIDGAIRIGGVLRGTAWYEHVGDGEITAT